MWKLLCLCCLSWASWVFVPAVAADEVRDALLQAADTEANGEYTRSRFLKIMRQDFDSSDERPKLLLIGDSHAQDFLNSVLENNYLQNYQLRTRYIPFRCQVFLSEKGQQQILPKDESLCAKSDSLQQAQAQIAEADVVILAARWKSWAVDLLPETLENLQLKPAQRLLVVGKKTFGKVRLRKYLRMSKQQLQAVANPLSAEDVALNQRMQQMLGDKVFVDQQRLICGAGDSCRLFTDELKLISYDGGHLTPAGAQYAGEKIFSHPALSDL